jgi:hypothetical protein
MRQLAGTENALSALSKTVRIFLCLFVFFVASKNCDYAALVF